MEEIYRHIEYLLEAVELSHESPQFRVETGPFAKGQVDWALVWEEF